jgi:DNA primase
MDQVSQIKQKLDIVDVVGSYVPLKKSGRNYKSPCPFHSEKTPSFMVSQELQIYKCFGCGASGDIFSFIQQIEGVDFPSALEQLADRAGIKLEKDQYDPDSGLKKEIYFINDLTAKFYHYLLTKHTLGKVALEYLTVKRGLSLATIDEFLLGYAPDGWDHLYSFMLKKGLKAENLLKAGVTVPRQSGSGSVDKFRARITFPLTSVDGKIVGFTARTLGNNEPKYLNTGETLVFHKTYFLFGLDKNKLNIKKEGATFVEGQMDLISAYQAGIKNVVSVSGTSLTDNQLVQLKRYTNDITFCFDSDTAGVAASYRAVEMAERQNFNIKVALIPSPYKDLDELIKADREAAAKALKASVPVYDYYLVTAIKKHDRNSALGKKLIMDELITLFSRISNPVLLDHYTKLIARELDLSEDSVSSVMRKGATGELPSYDKGSPEEVFIGTKKDSEGYLLALLLKAEVEIAKKYVEKVKPEEYQSEASKVIAEKLAETLEDRKKPININVFMKDFDEETKKTVSDLYMWDIPVLELGDEAKISSEMELTVKRIKSGTTKSSLKALSEEIKLAELEKDSDKIEKLTKKFERLSKGLL